jgi:hypothetical protein
VGKLSRTYHPDIHYISFLLLWNLHQPAIYTLTKTSDDDSEYNADIIMMLTIIIKNRKQEQLSRYKDRLLVGELEFVAPRARGFSLPHGVQTGSGVHPVSYPRRIGGRFPGGKETAA